MYKLAVLLLLTGTLAKIIKPKYDYILIEYHNSIGQVDPIYAAKKTPSYGSAWVLNLNGVDELRLRLATTTEEDQVFPESGIGSGLSSRQGKRLKKDDPTKSQATPPNRVGEVLATNDKEKAILSEILRIINKFALTAKSDPASYLPENNDDGPSLKLYFKDPLTLLVVRVEGRQWNYVIRPPTPFPEWFYEEHTTDGHDSKGDYIKVPKTVKMEFFKALLNILTRFFSLPV